MDLAQIKQRLTLYERLMRLDKPIGTLLLLWPTLWALWIASGGRPDWVMLWIFCLGTLLMRSAGCIMNDLADRDFDAHVKRTKDRPLAAGLVSVKEALWLAAALTLAAFALVLTLNPFAIGLSFVALALAASYPFTKRFLSIPQAYLGVTFGFGIPMAFAAVADALPPPCWWLLLANIFWVLAYDTEYAMVDRDDDRKIGIRTAAILFGRFDVLAVMSFHAAFLAALAAIGAHLDLGWPYYAGLAIAIVPIGYQYSLIRTRESARCFRAFLNNNWVGAAVFAGIALALALRRGL
jgi:4-hydroxybenzoate polyprenyltransferase